MDEAGGEGGEDEMTEPKCDQDLADQSSERDDLGQVRSNELKIQRKGSIMSPMKNNIDDDNEDNEASGDRDQQRAQRTRPNNSNKFTVPL